jgi:crotonobetainyl-CoA:carnitine CoA-transferase CaiB-like acyl-CoA transferase
MDNMNTLPLEGVRVADFTRVQAGPQATLWLSVMGAEVIRIESRQRPDMLRFSYSLMGSELTLDDLNKGSYFASLNMSKKSCTLNLTRPEGIEIAKQIIKISDVVVENYAPGVMERFGLDYPSLKNIKPDIVMASLSGMGQTGPDKKYLGYAPTIHAYSGLAAYTGYRGTPCKIFGGFFGDAISAQFMAFATQVALHHRFKMGEGQHIDISLAESTISAMSEYIMDYTMNKKVRRPMGNRDEIMAPHGCYRCAGKGHWVAIAVSTEEEWAAFCKAIGNPDLSMDKRFSDRYSRWQHQDELDVLIEKWTVNHTPYEVMEILQSEGVAAAPSLGIDELLDDPHLTERGLFLEMDHPVMGRGMQSRLPWRQGDCPGGKYQPAPLLGEHNDYVFNQLLGISEGEINALVEQQVIY